MTKVIVAIALGVAAASAFALWPVCVALSADTLASFQPSIEQRTDRDFHVQVFQRRNGQWHQCKTRISRTFFF